MPRALRVEYEGAIYHVLNRGDRREDIFVDDTDREMFVKTLGQACGKAGWEVHAYCLMRNHFHLVMETPQPTLVAGMKWLLGTYTQRFNARHRMRGHLFAGRYKALLVDGSENSYLRTVCDYVHLNPARAGIVESGRGLESYRWSSYPAYLMTRKRVGKRVGPSQEKGAILHKFILSDAMCHCDDPTHFHAPAAQSLESMRYEEARDGGGFCYRRTW